MTDYTVPTLHGRTLLLHKELDTNLYSPPDEVVLNKRPDMNVYPTTALPTPPKFKLNCWGIGNGGHKVPASGGTRPSPVYHTTEQAALYRHIPFRIVEPANDLTEAEMLNYRFRVTQTISGTDYILYYFKKISSFTLPTEVSVINNSGVLTQTTLVRSVSNRDNPSPVTIPSNTPVNSSNRYLATYVNIPLVLTHQEIQDIITAIDILYPGDPKVISEICINSGVEEKFSITSGTGANVTIDESLGTIVSYFINTFYMLDKIPASNGITLNINIGQNEPIQV